MTARPPTLRYPVLHHRAQGAIGLLAPVSNPGEWHSLMDAIAASWQGGPTEVAVRVRTATWRTKQEQLPQLGLLAPRTKVFLAHLGEVRCWLPLVAWNEDDSGLVTYLELTLDAARLQPVALEWRFDPGFNRGWRYACWTPACHLEHPQWRQHGPHGDCAGDAAVDSWCYQETVRRGEKARRR